MIRILEQALYKISDGSGARNRIFGYPESAKKWQVDHGFSSFFAVGMLLFEKSSNMPQKIWEKMKESLVQLALNPFFG